MPRNVRGKDPLNSCQQGRHWSCIRLDKHWQQFEIEPEQASPAYEMHATIAMIAGFFRK